MFCSTLVPTPHTCDAASAPDVISTVSNPSLDGKTLELAIAAFRAGWVPPATDASDLIEWIGTSSMLAARDVPLRCPSKPILHQLREEVHRAEAAFEAASKSVTDAVPNRVSKALQELDAAAVWDLCSVDEAALPASAWREHIEIALSEIRGS